MFSEIEPFDENDSSVIPAFYLRAKLEVEYLDPDIIESAEINAVAFGNSLARLTKSELGIIPAFPNPRGLDTTQEVFLGMLETLRDNPDLYVSKNRGAKISAFVENIEDTESGTTILTLAFAPPSDETIGQGVHDGQHTLFSFVRARLDGINVSAARARILILNKYLPKESEGIITTEWQQSYRHDKRTKYNTQGKFQELKKVIPQAWKVAYYQNQPDVSSDLRSSVDHLLQLLCVVDFENYNWLNARLARHPVSFATNFGSNYDSAIGVSHRLSCLIPDLIAIEEALLVHIRNDFQRSRIKLPGFHFPTVGQEHNFKATIALPNGRIFQMIVPKAILLPIISSFRQLLKREETGVIWKIDFRKNPDKLDKLIKQLWSSAKTSISAKVALTAGIHTSAILIREREFWHSFCSIAHAFCEAECSSDTDLSNRIIN